MLFSFIIFCFTLSRAATEEKPAILQELNWLKDEIKVVDQPWTQVQEYIDAAVEGFDWYRPRIPPFYKERDIMLGQPVWWYDPENQWWMTGTVTKINAADRADVFPTMVPPSMEQELGSIRKNVRVLYPNAESIMWKAQKNARSRRATKVYWRY